MKKKSTRKNIEQKERRFLDGYCFLLELDRELNQELQTIQNSEEKGE